jgi:mRNA interferase RelE/StbE
VTYKIRWEMTACRAWRKFDAKTALMILHDITDLSADPFPAASTVLVEGDGLRSLRVGNYRVIYEVVEDVVTIWEVGHRGEIYR